MNNPTKKILVSREKIITVPANPVNNIKSKNAFSQKTLFYIVIFIILYVKKYIRTFYKSW